MRKNEITACLSNIAFDFFYWFSRFEFALKESGYLKSHIPGTKAEPGWQEFCDKWKSNYTVSDEARYLFAKKPEQQIVMTNDQLGWRSVDLTKCESELEKVVRLVTTVRNNLFHGGKHGAAGWDDPERTERLLVACKVILDQFAKMAFIEADYMRDY